MARFTGAPTLATAAAACALLVILGVSACAAFDMSGLMDSIRNVQSSGGALVRDCSGVLTLPVVVAARIFAVTYSQNRIAVSSMC